MDHLKGESKVKLAMFTRDLRENVQCILDHYK